MTAQHQRVDLVARLDELVGDQLLLAVVDVAAACGRWRSPGTARRSSCRRPSWSASLSISSMKLSNSRTVPVAGQGHGALGVDGLARRRPGPPPRCGSGRCRRSSPSPGPGRRSACGRRRRPAPSGGWPAARGRSASRRRTSGSMMVPGRRIGHALTQDLLPEVAAALDRVGAVRVGVAPHERALGQQAPPLRRDPAPSSPARRRSRPGRRTARRCGR